MASVLALVLLGSSLIHYSQLTGQSKHINALRNEIVLLRKETADKRVELADIACDTDDLTKHNIFAIKERMQQAYTKAFKKGMTTKEIAGAVGMTEDEVKELYNEGAVSQ